MARDATVEFRLGPFIGGINNYSDASAIADDELVDCVNFDIDLDGSLKSRTPWRLLLNRTTTTSVASTSLTCSQTILNTFVYEKIRFIVYSTDAETTSGSYYAKIYWVDGVNAGTTATIVAGDFTRCVRYYNDLYLVPNINTTHGGYKYNLDTGVVTSIPTMPRGYSCSIYKDRLWIGGRRDDDFNSRVFCSELGDLSTWPSSNFFDINVGDGDAVQELMVYNDNLMLFKDSATYVLTYDTQLSGAVIQVINDAVGVQGPRTVVSYENSIFLMMHNQIYEMSNYDFQKISIKIPIDYDVTMESAPYNPPNQWWKWNICLSLVGDRLYARFYNKLYVYHLRTKSWTRFSSNDVNIDNLGPVLELDSTNTSGNTRGWKTYVGTTALRVNIDSGGPGTTGAYKLYDKLFIMDDKYEGTYHENGNITAVNVDIPLTIKTKIYDVGLPHRFKRLMHWGVDCISGRLYTVTAFISHKQLVGKAVN
jgi:hypothetical protein